MLALTNARIAATNSITGMNPYAHAYQVAVGTGGRFQDGFVPCENGFVVAFDARLELRLAHAGKIDRAGRKSNSAAAIATGETS